MGLLDRLNNFQIGEVADPDQVDAEFDQIINKINGNLEDANMTDVTINDSSSPTGDQGKPFQFLSKLASIIKSITGKSSWRTAPATTLEELNTWKNSVDAAGDGKVDFAESADKTPASISHETDTGIVTNTHTRQVNCSIDARAIGQGSQVNCSELGTISARDSQINCGYNNYVNVSGISSQINASDYSSIDGLNSQINASHGAMIKENTDQGQINCSYQSQIELSHLARCAQVNASFATLNKEGYSVAGGYGPMSPSTANRTWHIFSETGNIEIAGTLSQNSIFSDYGEYFESIDGGEIPPGTLVTLEGRFLRPANIGDKMLGVISKTAGIVLGDSAFHWARRYLIDEFGGYIYEEIDNPEIADLENKLIDAKDEMKLQKEINYLKLNKPKIKVKKENPDWDREMHDEYKTRSERAEWNVVGLLGQCYVRIDNTVEKGNCITAKNGVGTKDINGYYVMEITTPYSKEKGYGVAVCLIK